MRRVLKYCILIVLMSCSKRDNIVFLAGDDLHTLTLYERNHEFNMIHNGFNTVEGNYLFRNDTIFLTYGADEYVGSEPERPANEILTRIVGVDKKKKRIYSLNGQQFCGDIGIDELK